MFGVKKSLLMVKKVSVVDEDLVRVV